MDRVFTMHDQLEFARLSGDFNPIHVDPVAARRFLYGRPVVHGIHALLWAIDKLVQSREQGRSIDADGGASIESLKATFSSPIIVDERVELKTTPASGGKWKLELSRNQARLLSCLISLGPAAGTAVISTELPAAGACRVLTAAELSTVSGRCSLNLAPALAVELFPNAARLLPRDQLAMLLAATRLVGMEAPGLNSLLTGLEFRRAISASTEMTYMAEDFDERFSMLSLRADGPGLSGKISAVLRPAPAAQASAGILKQLVAVNEFAGQRALVIGGSRGLGEVVVKELAAGGADVRFTFHRGESDAEKVVADIIATGGRASAFKYDIAADALAIESKLGEWRPTALYYFATPFIFSAVAGQFSSELFRSFCISYVDHFLDLFKAIQKLSPGLAGVLYPSSSALDQLPANMVEYSAAKGAAETLCRFLEKTNPHVHFVVPRLPRLDTDQTASLMPAGNLDPAEYMLKLLRQLHAESHGRRNRES